MVRIRKGEKIYFWKMIKKLKINKKNNIYKIYKVIYYVGRK